MDTELSEADESSLAWYGIYDADDRHGLIGDAALADSVCRTVLDVLRPRLRRAQVDAPFETTDMRGTPASAALRALQTRAARNPGRRGDPNMGIPLDLDRDEDWALLLDYASSSINVDLFEDLATDAIGTLHDCGASISLRLTADLAADLQGRLGSGLQVCPFTVGAYRPLLPVRLWRRLTSRSSRAK